ncbi:MAG: hypothetical protein Q8M07_04845, partial [Prosthecobacter sp.]|nr:hypothetical protein [Prosthecobacter sp.]
MPTDLNITRCSIIPALTAKQAKQKQMPELLALRNNLPARELVIFNPNNEMSVFHVPSDSQAMQCDYPRFAQQVSYMTEFLNSKPTTHPKSSHPDFMFMNAAIYMRAKFRCL